MFSQHQGRIEPAAVSAGPPSAPSEKVKEALLKGLIEKARQEQEEHERAPNKLWPSGIGRCLRAQYYSYFYPEVYDTRKLSIFATGKAIHQFLPEILRIGGVEVKATEVEVKMKHPSKEIYISGRVDVIIARGEGGEDVVVEIKSAKSLPKEPHRSHVLQLQCYLNHLRLERGVLLYWGKSTGEVEAYDVRADPAAMDEVWRRCEEVSEGIIKEEPPPREGAENGWECLYCEHFRPCYLGPLWKPLVVGEWQIYSSDGNIDELVLRRLQEALLSERDILILTDRGELQAEERLLRDGVPYTAILSKPLSYNGRWYEKAYEELRKIGAEVYGRDEGTRET